MIIKQLLTSFVKDVFSCTSQKLWEWELIATWLGVPSIMWVQYTRKPLFYVPANLTWAVVGILSGATLEDVKVGL